jgi:predicted RNase H-like HicB family nuclease
MLGDDVGACYGLSQGQRDGLAMKTSKRFVIEIEREADGRWIAEIPVLPGVLAYGATRKDALARVKALALRVLAERLEHGETAGELEGLFEAA